MKHECPECGIFIESETRNFACPRCNGQYIGLAFTKPEPIRQQPHYTQFQIQPVEFIAANNLNYLQGNIIKYIMRYKEKNGLEDLQKAKHYLDMLIQYAETGKVKP